jgi:hypothetical protein
VACGRVVCGSLQLPLLEGVVGNAHAVACVLGMAFSHQETRRLRLVDCIFVAACIPCGHPMLISFLPGRAPPLLEGGVVVCGGEVCGDQQESEW